MDIKTEIRDFLRSRRARITPEDVGLTSFGQRRVPGLRREEVATLAGLSVEYYNRLERGNLGGASETVLDALADALRLDEAERAHLFDLARASQPAARRARRATTSNVRPTVQWMLDSMTTAAAFASNGHLDVLSANQLGRALYAPMFRDGPQSANWARFVFLNRDAHEIYTDWDRAAKETVALLRLQAGGNPHDRALTDLIGELATKSEEFRVLWAAHNVRLHTKGVKRLNHPIVGELELHYDRLDLTADRLMLFVYTAEPGTRSAESLQLLASWAASEAEGLTPSDLRLSRGRRSQLAKWRCPTGKCRPKSIWRKASRLHPLVPRETKRWGDLYRRRSAVEREFGRLKHEYGLAFLRVRGIERVRLHADLTMLARLSLALAKARTVPRAA